MNSFRKTAKVWQATAQMAFREFETPAERGVQTLLAIRYFWPRVISKVLFGDIGKRIQTRNGFLGTCVVFSIG